jgi:hypothetical protein
MTMTDQITIDEIRAAGYVCSPNNTTEYSGVCVYPAGPGVPEPIKYSDIVVRDDRSVWVIANIRGTRHIHTFENMAHLVTWCGREGNGKISEGGQRHF